MSRFIKIQDGSILSKDTVEKSDLIDVKDKRCKHLIDTKYCTAFNAYENKWLPIPKI